MRKYAQTSKQIVKEVKSQSKKENLNRSSVRNFNEVKPRDIEETVYQSAFRSYLNGKQ